MRLEEAFHLVLGSLCIDSGYHEAGIEIYIEADAVEGKNFYPYLRSVQLKTSPRSRHYQKPRGSGRDVSCT